MSTPVQKAEDRSTRGPEMKPWAGLATLGAVACAAVLVTAGLSSAQTSTPFSAKLHWAMARSSLEHVSAVDPGQAARDFDSVNTLVQNSSPLSDRSTPPGWASKETDRWASFAQFAADVGQGAVPGFVKVVHYDNEAWPETPVSEQLHPAYYERRFCELAHRQGWLCYTGPGQDLCGVIAHPAGETYAQCYLGQNLAGKAARYADVVDIQAQALEAKGARAYASFLRRAAAQARAANPEVLVLGNIAPSPSERTISARSMYACAKAALPYVSGFYTTVGSGDGETMVSFLKLLDS